jgi:hypothetical protein
LIPSSENVESIRDPADIGERGDDRGDEDPVDDGDGDKRQDRLLAGWRRNFLDKAGNQRALRSLSEQPSKSLRYAGRAPSHEPP